MTALLKQQFPKISDCDSRAIEKHVIQEKVYACSRNAMRKTRGMLPLLLDEMVRGQNGKLKTI